MASRPGPVGFRGPVPARPLTAEAEADRSPTRGGAGDERGAGLPSRARQRPLPSLHPSQHPPGREENHPPPLRRGGAAHARTVGVGGAGPASASPLAAAAGGLRPGRAAAAVVAEEGGGGVTWRG